VFDEEGECMRQARIVKQREEHEMQMLLQEGGSKTQKKTTNLFTEHCSRASIERTQRGSSDEDEDEPDANERSKQIRYVSIITYV
jgi:hypothetical protein